MYQPKLRKRRSGLPILSNAEIDHHVEEFLKDYNPSVLSIPQPVDIEKFAEFYLGLSMDYVYLSHCGLILGRMIFQNVERVSIYLPKEKRAEYLYVERGTMLIDNTVLEDFKEYRLRSTIGHECGHWVFHSDYCTFIDRTIKQGILQPDSILGCKKTDIEGNSEAGSRKKLITDIDWLEHQAKYFSAAVLMPKTPFINAVSDLIGSDGFYEADLPNSLAKIFQVSAKSADIRLLQLGITRNKQEVSQKKYFLNYRRSEALCE